ncbi:MAG: hypothetical protein EOP86_25095 [Verrucomicrobiaceae bacterium]|nr:MAG: hypothetical protein EOP86_25095 [Verrucomicrobiaceae bacterium]
MNAVTTGSKIQTVIIIVLSCCLALTLLIKQKNKREPLPPEPSVKTEQQPNAGKERLPKMVTSDFSGTGLSDDAWKLDSSHQAAPAASSSDSPVSLEMPATLPALDAPTETTPKAGSGASPRYQSFLTNPD